MRKGCRHQTGLDWDLSDMGRPARREQHEAGIPGRPATRVERHKAAAVAVDGQAVVVPVAGSVPAGSLPAELLLTGTADHGEACFVRLMSGGMRADHTAPVGAGQAPQE